MSRLKVGSPGTRSASAPLDAARVAEPALAAGTGTRFVDDVDGSDAGDFADRATRAAQVTAAASTAETSTATQVPGRAAPRVPEIVRPDRWFLIRMVLRLFRFRQNAPHRPRPALGHGLS